MPESMDIDLIQTHITPESILPLTKVIRNRQGMQTLAICHIREKRQAKKQVKEKQATVHLKNFSNRPGAYWRVSILLLS
jgi:hypothetical protein